MKKIVGKIYKNKEFYTWDVIADREDKNIAIVIENLSKFNHNNVKTSWISTMVFDKKGNCLGYGGLYLSPNDESIYLGRINFKKVIYSFRKKNKKYLVVNKIS